EPAARARAAGGAAGRDDEQVRAELVDLVVDLGLRALPQPDGQHDRGDTDEDAEHRERRAEAVGAHRLGGRADRVAPGHDAPLAAAMGRTAPSARPPSSDTISPSRMWMVRWARS